MEIKGKDMEDNIIVEKYNEIFKKNKYVHLYAEDFPTLTHFEELLKKYKNEYAFYKKDKEKFWNNFINKKFDFTTDIYDYGKLLKKYNDSNFKIDQKIDDFLKYIKERNPDCNLKLKDKSIIYDDNSVQLKTVSTISSFISILKNNNLFEKNIYFRGQINTNWFVEPSIFRGDWINHEKEFLNQMVIHNPYDFEKCRNTLERLTKMQHYAAPTRLLDLTKNPYIALYFACESIPSFKEKRYGEVLFFKSDEKTEKMYDSDTVSIVSNLALMKSDFDTGNESLENEEFCEQSDIPYLLHQIRNEKGNFGSYINPPDLHSCFFVHVKLDNKRIMNQQGLFLLVGMKNGDKTKPANINQYYYKNKLNKNLIILIKDSVKKDLIKELSYMGITKSFIYPEIDDVADYLKTEVYPEK